jgi:CRISPR system Cascade subunit CasD
MGVRVDREGVPMRDYQTATGVMLAKGEIDHKRAVVSPRHYLSDAAFLVGLEGTDRNLLEQIHRALQFPVWPLSLGRKSFVPGLPPHLPDGVRQEELIDALSNYPRLASPQHTQPSAVRLMLEDRNKGSIRFDQPVAPFAERRFGLRYVELRRIYVPD